MSITDILLDRPQRPAAEIAVRCWCRQLLKVRRMVFTHIFEMLPVDAAKQLASPASAVLAFWPGPTCLPDCCHLFGLQRVCRTLACTC